MGAIEDVRKLLQDFVAPELRSINTRLDGIDKRIDGLETVMREGDERILKAIEQSQREILLILRLAQAEQRNTEFEKRVKALESKPTQ